VNPHPNTLSSAPPAMQRALRRASTRNRIGAALMILGVIGFVAGATVDGVADLIVRLLPDWLLRLASYHPQKLLYVIGPVLFGAGTLLRRSAGRRMSRLRVVS